MRQHTSNAALLALMLVFGLAFAPPSRADNLVSRPVGFVRLSVPAERQILASMPFDPFDPSEDAVLSGQLTGAPERASADKLRQWHGDALVPTSMFKTASTGDPAKDGRWFRDDTTWTPADLTVESGQGFWLENRQLSDQSVFLTGRVVLDPVRIVKLAPGLHPFGYPFSTGIDLNETDLANDGAKGADAIGSADTITEAGSGRQFWLLDESGNPSTGQWVGEDKQPSDAVLLPGTGHWFSRKLATPLIWSVQRPYADAFPANDDPPHIVGMRPNAAKDAMILTVACHGAPGETLDVFYKDGASDGTFTSDSGWLTAAKNVPVDGRHIIEWADEGGVSRPKITEVTLRYYMVARADVDADGNDIPDAREAFVQVATTSPLPPSPATPSPVAPAPANGHSPIEARAVMTGSPYIELEVVVGSSEDDAEENIGDGRVILTSNALELAEDPRSDWDPDQVAAMRFPGISIPRGATIKSAHVQFTVDEASSGPASLIIQGQAADHALAFTAKKTDICSRPRTEAAVSWSPADWTIVGTAGPKQQTEDISSIVQEIVDRGGWAAGNALVVLISGTGNRVAESYDGDGSAAPRLRVEYVVGGVQTVKVPVSASMDDAKENLEGYAAFEPARGIDAGEALPAGSISGAVYYAGGQSGRIRVIAVESEDSWDTTLSTTLWAPGSFTITDAHQGRRYWIKAFRDSNNDGNLGTREARGVHSGDALPLADALNGVSVLLADPPLTNRTMNWGWSATKPVPADYDGDGATDLAVYHGAGSKKNWYIRLSSTDKMMEGGAIDWGYESAKPIPCDYDGDRKADLAVYDPATLVWYIRLSKTGKMMGGPNGIRWGWAGVIPAPGDYDGDGADNIAVYHPQTGNWYYRPTGGGNAVIKQFGWNGPTPVPAVRGFGKHTSGKHYVANDFDGDGTTDYALYFKPEGEAIWNFLLSKEGYKNNVKFGWSKTDPVPADYDGDGTTDMAVYHPAKGDWYLMRSKAGFVAKRFGPANAIPVPGDFDGDGKTDLATFDPSTGDWKVDVMFHTLAFNSRYGTPTVTGAKKLWGGYRKGADLTWEAVSPKSLASGHRAVAFPQSGTVTMDADRVEVIGWREQFELTTEIIGGGTISPQTGWLARGSVVDLTYDEQPQYKFVGWTVDGERKQTVDGTAITDLRLVFDTPHHVLAKFVSVSQDEDGDGWSDWQELLYFGNTTPTLTSDYDNDNITDWDEINAYGSDPTHAETWSPPFFANFEESEGYSPGPLSGQKGWQTSAEESAGVQSASAVTGSGQQAVRLAGMRTSMSRRLFPVSPPNRFVKTQMLIYVGDQDSSPPQNLPTDTSCLVSYDYAKGIVAYNGADEAWVVAGSSRFTNEWVRLEILQDNDRKTWALKVNGKPALSDLGFKDVTVGQLQVNVRTGVGQGLFCDELSVTTE